MSPESNYFNKGFLNLLKNENSDSVRNLLNFLPLGIALLDRRTLEIHYINKRFTEICGYTKKDIKTFNDLIELVSIDYVEYNVIFSNWDRQLMLLRKTETTDYKEYEFITKSGTEKNVALKLSLINNDVILVCMEDITQEKRTKEAYEEEKRVVLPINDYFEPDNTKLDMSSVQYKALLKIHNMTHKTVAEISDFAIDAALIMTNSTVGYIFLMNEEETELTLAAWSKSAMKECMIVDKFAAYKLEDTGLWGEAARQKNLLLQMIMTPQMT